VAGKPREPKPALILRVRCDKALFTLPCFGAPRRAESMAILSLVNGGGGLLQYIFQQLFISGHHHAQFPCALELD
jgi:hypothetical protein